MKMCFQMRLEIYVGYKSLLTLKNPEPSPKTISKAIHEF